METSDTNRQKTKRNLFKKIAGLAALILVLIIIVILFNFGKTNKLSGGSAALSWMANAEPDLAGYKIYYGTLPRAGDCPPAGYSEKLDVKKTDTPEKPAYKIANLEIGKTYYFSVTSYDASGNESCFSPEMSKNILQIEY